MRHSIDSPYSDYRTIGSIDLFFSIATEYHCRVKLVTYSSKRNRWRLVADEHKEPCPRNFWKIWTSCRTKKFLLKALLAHSYYSLDKEYFILHTAAPAEKAEPSQFVSFESAIPMEGQHIEVKTFSGLTMEAIYQQYLDLEGVCDSWRPLD